MTAPLPFAAVDPIAIPLAGALLTAMINAYDDPQWGLESPCVAGLVSGANLIADYCCEGTTAAGAGCQGQLTIRVVDVYPTEQFPQPRSGAIPTCGTSWAVIVEVAVLRCALVIDTSAQPPVLPSMDDEMDVAERALADAGLIRHILTDYAVSQSQAIAFGAYTPMGPEGGCVGGAVNATFLVE